MIMKVGIEPNLTQVKDYLENMGCDVSIINDNQANYNSFDAIVITGENDDFMGMEDTATDTVIIEAAGLTPQEVFDEIKSIEEW